MAAVPGGNRIFRWENCIWRWSFYCVYKQTWGHGRFLDSIEAAWPYTTVGYSQFPTTKPKTFTETLPNVTVQRMTYVVVNSTVSLLGCCSSLSHPILWENVKKLTREVLLRVITSLRVDRAFTFCWHCNNCNARLWPEGGAFSDPYLIVGLRDTTSSVNQRPKATLSVPNVILTHPEYPDGDRICRISRCLTDAERWRQQGGSRR